MCVPAHLAHKDGARRINLGIAPFWSWTGFRFILKKNIFFGFLEHSKSKLTTPTTYDLWFIESHIKFYD